MWVVDWLARRLGIKKLNQSQNQIFRSLSPQFPPTVIARLKIQSPIPHLILALKVLGLVGSCCNWQVLQMLVGCSSALWCQSSKATPGHRHTPLNWLKIETEQTGNFLTNAPRLWSTRYSCNHPQFPPTEQKHWQQKPFTAEAEK